MWIICFWVLAVFVHFLCLSFNIISKLSWYFVIVKENCEGSRPEWCVSTIYHAWDTPFWSGTLDFLLFLVSAMTYLQGAVAFLPARVYTELQLLLLACSLIFIFSVWIFFSLFIIQTVLSTLSLFPGSYCLCHCLPTGYDGCSWPMCTWSCSCMRRRWRSTTVSPLLASTSLHTWLHR